MLQVSPGYSSNRKKKHLESEKNKIKSSLKPGHLPLPLPPIIPPQSIENSLQKHNEIPEKEGAEFHGNELNVLLNA